MRDLSPAGYGERRGSPGSLRASAFALAPSRRPCSIPRAPERSAALRTAPGIARRRSAGSYSSTSAPRRVQLSKIRVSPPCWSRSTTLLEVGSSYVDGGLAVQGREGKNVCGRVSKVGWPASALDRAFSTWMTVPVRPNGPAEPSPGLKPKADALGKKAESPSGLKGRENQGLIEPKRRAAELSRPFRPPWFVVLFFSPRASACGLSPGLGSAGPLGRVLLGALSRPGLRPISRPVGTHE
jgi:hypothetical protein